MTTALILTTVASIFTTGFLLGDSRAVRRCNSQLDDHLLELEKMIFQSETSTATDTDRVQDSLTLH